jgi:DNA polymerase III alpha subunit (gram-positive type)
MDLLNNKYVIVEVIPTSIKKENGVLVQLSALKLDGIRLIDRFDYRINEDKVLLKDFIDMCSYDKESFTYLDSTEEILNKFSKWIDNLPLLIIDNDYTRNYLHDISNTKESILDYLGVDNDSLAIDNIINKYNLEPSNYIVDLLYEALIQEID